MSCARYRALISRYIDGELTPRQRADLLHHVETCPSCSQALARYRQGEVLLKKLPESRPASHLKADVLREVRRQSRRRTGWRRLVGGGGRLPARVGAVCVLLLLLGITGYVVLPRDGDMGATDVIAFVTDPSPTPAFLLPPPTTEDAVVEALTQPHLIGTEPLEGAGDVATSSLVVLRFDQAMDRSSVERAFRIEPPTTGQFSWEADNELRFSPDQVGMLRGITYTVTLADGARSLTGAEVPSANVLQFSTLALPALQAVLPAPAAVGVPVTSTIVLTFTQPMATDSVSLSLRGASAPVGGKLAAPTWSLGGTTEWSPDGTVAFFHPALPLPAGPVQFEIAAGAHDQLGGALPSYSWPLVIAASERAVSFAGQRLELLTSAPGVEPTLSYNATGGTIRDNNVINFSAYQLPQALFESLLPRLLDPGLSLPSAPWPTINSASMTLARQWSAQENSAVRGSSASEADTVLALRAAGAYLVGANMTGGQGDQKIVVLADTGLIVQGDGGHWTVWASRFNSADPITGTRVVLYDQQGGVLDGGQVDGLGLRRFDLPANVQPVLAVAIRDGIVGMSRIEPANETPETGQATNAVVLTDQPAYRPGDVFHFKAVLPAAGGAQSEIVQVTLLDPERRTIAQQRLKADTLGAVSGSFALAAGAQDGAYSLELQSARTFYVHELTVLPEAGTQPELIVSAKLSSPAIRPGDTVTATLQVLYSPGAPAARVPVTLTVRDALGAPLSVYTGTTTTNGTAQWKLTPLTTISGGMIYLQAVAGTSLRGENIAVVPVAPADLLLSQQLNSHSFSGGETLVVTATLTSSAGIPLAGRQVRVGIYSLGAQNDIEISKVDLTSDAAGVVSTTFALPMQGSFVLRSTSSGAEVRDQFWVYGGQDTVATVPTSLTNRLQLTPDKASYSPGEVARLFAQAGEGGPALLISSYDDRVVGQQTIRLASSGSVIDVTIPAPPPLATALHLKVLRFVTSSPAPSVITSEFTLPLTTDRAGVPGVAIELDKANGLYAPGETARARISLLAPNGLPTAGEVVVRVVGVGLIDGAPADGSGASQAILPQPEAARFWNANLTAGAGGIVTATVPLPSTPGNWQLEVWGISSGGVAVLTVPINASSPVRTIWSPPTRLVQGDTAPLTVELTNTRADTVPVEVRLQADGAIVFDQSSPGQQSLVLAPGQTVAVTWRLTARAGGSGRLVLDIGWPGGSGWAAASTRQTTLIAVDAYGLQETVISSGALRGAETVNMILPSSVAPEKAQLDVRIDPSLAALLAGAYGTEVVVDSQGRGPASAAAGRLVAGVALNDLFARQNLDTDLLPVNAAASRALDLQFLYAAQDESGGWAELPGGVPSVDTTAAVLRALWLLQQTPANPNAALPQIDPQTIVRGLDWLDAALEQPAQQPGVVDANADRLSLSSRARALYVLALFDLASADEARALLGRSGELDLATGGWLALALSRLGLAQEAALLLDRLPIATLDAEAENVSDSAAAAAVSLAALLFTDPSGARSEATTVADYLLRQRQGIGWNDMVSGDAIYALANYAAGHPEQVAPFSYSVLVNGTLIREAQVGRDGAAGSLSVTVAGILLHTGANDVRIESSDGRIYYSLTARALRFSEARPISSDAARDFGGNLLRTYQPATVNPFTIGSVVAVVYTVTVNARYDALQISDPLPAALERIGGYTLERVGAASPTNSPAPGLTVLSVGGETGDLVISLPEPGTYRLSYRTVIMRGGDFVALPATLHLPGVGTVLARSATAELKIAK